MYTTNHLFKIWKTHSQQFNMGVGVMNVANHLDVDD